MKPPASYGVGLRPDSRPNFTADRVVPLENPNAKVAQQHGEALGDVGLGVLRINEVLQERLDRTKAVEADAKIADGYREILTGPKGYQTLLGRGATDTREDTLKALDEHRERILGALTPQQRQHLTESDTARYQRAREHVDSHYTRQLSVYEQGQTEARAEGLMQDAVTAALNPAATLGPTEASEYEEKRTALRGALVSLGEMRGESTEAIERTLEKVDDNLAGAIVGKLLDPQEPRSRDAADFLAKHGEGLSLKMRATLRASIAQGGTNEHAQAIMVGLSESGLSTFDQLKKLDVMHAAGLPLAVRDAAETRVLERSRLAAEAKDNAGKDLLTRAKVWKAQNPTAELPVEDRERLRTLGVESAFDLHVATDGKYGVRAGGLRVMRMTDDEMLAAYPTAAALELSLEGNLPVNDVTTQVLRYKKARGEQLSPAEAFHVANEDLDFRFLNGLPGSQKFFGSASEKRLDADRTALKVAVTLRMNELVRANPKLKEQPALVRTQAWEDVWANGGVVNGRWIPSVAQTPEETAAARFDVPAAGSTSPFSTVQSARTAAFKDSGQRVSSLAYTADGDRIAMVGSEDDDIPTPAEIATELAAANGGRSATQPEIAAKLAELLANVEARKAAATEAAGLENRLRAKAVLDNLDAQISRNGNWRYEAAVKHRAVERAMLEASMAGSTGFFARSADSKAALLDKRYPTPTLEAAYADAAQSALLQYRALFDSVGLPGDTALLSALPAETLAAIGLSKQQTAEMLRNRAGLAPVRAAADYRARLTLTEQETQRLTQLRAYYAKTQEPPK